MQSSFELTPKQAEYIRNANHRWNISVGAVRSGKSYCQISYCIPSRLLERRGKRGLRVILGATRENIERNILQPMRDIFGDSIASTISSQNYSKIFGEKVYCIGADNIRQVSKIRGSEIAYCAIDEATDINEEVFEMLKSRLSLPWSCCDITTNPASPNHWFKDFIDSKDRGVDIYLQEYTIYDNPFLPEEYIKAIESEYAGTVWYDRYILGKWTLAEGLVFPNFADCLYSVEPDVIPEKFCISLDYGTSNPFAAVLWKLVDGTWYGIDEIYYSGRSEEGQKTDGEYLDMLNNFVKFIVPSLTKTETNAWGRTEEYTSKIRVIVDPSAASFIALLRRSNIFTPISANNDVLNGIRDTNTAIKDGLIKINTRCKNWIREARSYVWDTNAVNDKPIKDNDHLMDATRYFVKTMRIVKPKSSEEYTSVFRR